MRFDVKKIKTDIVFSNYFAEKGNKSGLIATELKINGAPETKKVLAKVSQAITIYTARAVASVIIDLLARAQPRVPYDTGKLRRSGRASIKFGRTGTRYLGVGRMNGTVHVNYRILKKSLIKNVRTIRGEVSYNRIGDGGLDVALWAHEELLPYEVRGKKQLGKYRPTATKQYTGPKYLELPWIEKSIEYKDFLKKEIGGKNLERNIALISKIKQTRVGDYDVDFVDVVIEKINYAGYFYTGGNLKT